MGGAIAFSVLSVVSCNVGLGESVDTQAPSIEITYPPVSSIIRDVFTLYGTYTDDKGLQSVKVSVLNTATKQNVVENVAATINPSDNTWQIELNSYNESNKNYYNGWQFADGTYQVSVVATDGAGHSSGTVSRTFDIDNTPPVFIVSNPGAVKKQGSSASAYGSIFTIDGTIADDHTISTMDITVYNEKGEIVSKEKYDGSDINYFHEEEIATAGGTSVQIATYDSESTEGRYYLMHPSSEGTEYYTCSVRLTDNAKVYKTPNASKDSRSAVQKKADDEGNSTSTVYLYDDVYTKLMSSKKGLGLSANDLKNILNKTSTNENASKALDVLNKAEIDTEKQNDDTNLYFSLNPQANPTYTVNGFAFDFKDDGIIQQASNGNSLSVTVTQGLDGTKIDLDGSNEESTTVKVWIKEYASRPSNSSTINKEITELATEITKLENNETKFVEYSEATEDNVATKSNDWTLLYDYGKHNSGESSVETKTFSVTLPEMILMGKYYIIAVTGSDVDGVPFLQNEVFGFVGNEAGVPPTLKVLSPSNGSLEKSSEFSFTGTAAISSTSLFVSELKATLSVTDQNTNEVIGTFTEDITRESATAAWNGSKALSLNGENWSFSPSKISSYEKIKAAEQSGKSYLFELELYGKSSSGHDATVNSNVQIDTIVPVVEISSITPTVNGTEYDESENVYVNGTVSVKGNVEETNLENVEMQIISDGTVKETRNLGKVFTFSEKIDTTKLSDLKSLEIKITATDKVGNTSTYSSMSATGSSYAKLVVSQESDRPRIMLTNSSNSDDFTNDATKISEQNGNLFGTTSNNKITASITDDDAIASVLVTVYDESGKEIDSSLVYDGYKANPYIVYPQKTTYSLSYILPPKDGVYRIKIDAYDYIKTETNVNEYGEGSTGEYYIAVSSGAPSIQISNLSRFVNEKPTFNGTVATTAKNVYAEIIEPTSAENIVFNTVINSDKTTWGTSISSTSPSKELDNGTYKIVFTAENAYGQTNPVTAEFTVDKNPPTVSGKEENKNVYLDLSSYLTITADAVDNKTENESGVANVYYLISESDTMPDFNKDDLKEWKVMLPAASGYTATVNLRDINVAGDKNLYAWFAAIDNAEKQSVSQNATTIVCDESAPVISDVKYVNSDNDETSVASGNEVKLNSEQITLKVTVTDTNVKNLTGTSDNEDDSTVTIEEPTSLKDSAGKEIGKVYTVKYKTLTTGNTTTLVLNATDSNERKSQEFIVKTKCDTTKPEITIVSPSSSSAMLNTSPLVVQVSVKENNYNDSKTQIKLSGPETYSQTVNFVSSSEDADGNKITVAEAKFYDVKEGSYTVKANSEDDYGNKAEEKTINITYDTTAPTTTINGTNLYDTQGKAIESNSALSLGTTYLAKETFTLSGTITESYLSSVVINGKEITPSENRWTYTPDAAALTDGTLPYTIVLKDKSGNQSSSTIYITYDTKSPTLTIASPASESNTNNGNVTVSGNVIDTGSGIKNIRYTLYKIDDSNSESKTEIKTESKDVSTSGTFSFDSVSLASLPTGNSAEGKYSLLVTATDILEHSANSNDITFYYDMSGPILSNAAITTGSLGSYTKNSVEYKVYASSTFDVSVEASDMSSVAQVYANSSTSLSNSVANATSGTYTGKVTGFATASTDATKIEGNASGSILISANDKWGNKSSEVKIENIIVDTTAPTATIKTSSELTKAEFTLSGTAKDELGLLKSVVVTDSLDSEKSWSITPDSQGNWTLSLTPSADGKGNDSTKNYTKDGKHVYTITATDKAGNTNSATVNVTTDTTVPKWDMDSDAYEKMIPYIGIKSESITVGGDSRDYYKTSTLNIRAKAKDETSGVKTLLYNVLNSNASSTTSPSEFKETGGNTNFSIEGLADGMNTIAVKAVDEAGNESSETKIIAYIDTSAPEEPTLISIDNDKTSIEEYKGQTKQKLVNGNSDVTFALSVKDSGVDNNNLYSSGIKSIEVTKIGNKTLSSPISGVVSTALTDSITITIPAKELSSGAVIVKVTDNAGNSTESQMFSINLDNISPSITLNTPTDADSATTDKIDVNGTITLPGIVSDNNELAATPVKVEYNTTSESASSGWNSILTNYSEGTSSYSASLDTTKLTDNQTIYIRATATDSAGNTKSANTTLFVNQNTDRPVIQITSINDASSWLSNKTLRGTITDDDGISSFQISEDGSSYSDVTVSNGSWSYDIKGSDGSDKKIYFKVKDSAGTTFTTASTTEKTPYYLFAKTTSKDAGYSKYGFECTSPLSLKLDTQNPFLGVAGLDIQTDSGSLKETKDVVLSSSTGVLSTYGINTSRYAGGNSKYIKFYVPAYDANIDKVTVSISDANGNNETANLKEVSSGTEGAITGTEITLIKTDVVSSGSTTSPTPTTYTYYESSPLSVSRISTGQKNVTFVVTDHAENSTSKTESFYIDNSVGENSITITSPDSSGEVTGTVNVVGITSDVGIGIESIEWLIPRKGEKDKTDAQLSALEGWTNSNNTKSTGLFNFKFLAGGQYDFVNYDNVSSYDVEHNESTNIYTIPLYLKATDKLGNVYIKKDFYITHNPDADRPSTEISYPTSNDYDSGENYITLSGTIRLNGTVQIPSGTTNVGKVFIQIGSVGADGNIDWSGQPSEGSILAKEFKTLGGIVIPTKNSDGTYSIIETSSGTTYTKTTYVTSDWWGIPCTTKTSTWSISINTNGDLNPSSANETTNIAVRACAINEDGKMGLWTTVKTAAPVIHVDQNAPSQTAVVRQYSNFAENSLDSNISVQKDYVSEMYLKGKYYLVVTLSDNDSLNESSINVKRGSATISDWVKSEQIKGTDNRIYRKIYIPVDTTSMTTSSVNYTVYVEDSSGHSSTNTYTFYIDNIAPAFDTLKGNEQNLLGENVPVVQNSNYAYTLSGAMTEAGSGLERVLFYFLRQDGTDTTGSSKRMLDAMVKYDDYKSDATDFYVSNLNEYILSQGSESFAMYGKTYSGSLDENRTTFTISDSSYNNNVHIRAGGLIYIGGEYHKISSRNGSSVIFEGEVPDSITVQEAGFPYGQVVDCTEKAILDSSNKYVITSDDGDGMPETMTKVATIYNWDGSIYSDVMPDGPCEIVLIAFDKAGNVSGKTIKTSIQNNAPRIAKLHIGTDLTGDGKYSDSEFNTYSFISGDAKQDLFKDSVDFKTGDSNYGYEKPFKITNGLAVVPEFTGGNGDIYMKFLNDAPSVKNYQQKSGESDSSFYAAENDNSKVTATFSVNKNTTTGLENTTKSFVVNDENLKNLEDGTGKSMSFTFWDSTDGTTCGIDSNYCFVRISDFTLGLKDSFAPTTVVNPFYWNSLTDNSIYGSDKAKSYKDLQGHIELEANLPRETFSSSKTGVYDLDPKVSGKVTLTGYAYDDQRLGKISVKFIDGLLSAETEVATYSNGTWDIPQKSITSDGYEFTVSSNEEDGAYFNQNGHKVYWTLSLDTEKITNFAKADVSVTIKATDAKGANGGNVTSTTDIVNAETDSSGMRTIIDGTTNYPVYKMDVVPYITEVRTELSEFYRSSPSVYARSAKGKYPVNENESITLKGYNLGTSRSVTLNGTTLNLSGSDLIYNIGKSATSGKLEIAVNFVNTLNNLNDNSVVYNQQPNNVNNNTLTDDIEFDVWQFKNAAEPKNGAILQPHMKIGPSGQIGFSYSNATLYFNMPGRATDNATYSQTPFGRNFGGFTQNAFAYDSAGNAYGVALCPDTSGVAGMSANLQFFSEISNLEGGEGGGDLNNNYYNQKYSRRIENTSLKIDGSTITQNINRIQSPSMTTYSDSTGKKYVYVAYYDELTRQVRFRVGSIGSSDFNDIGLGLVDLAGSSVQGRVAGSGDEPKLNANTTRDSVSGYIDHKSSQTINVSDVTNDIYVRAKTPLNHIYAWSGYNTAPFPGDEMSLVDEYYIVKMQGTSKVSFNLNNGSDANKTGDLSIESAGVWEWNGTRLEKKTSGTITYSSKGMPTYDGYKYCQVVAASGVSGGTEEYSSSSSKKAGQYVALSSLKDGTAVIAWYDSGAGRLAFSYNKNPRNEQTSLKSGTDEWQKNSYYVSDDGIRAGTHVSMAVDASDGVHLAYYSASGGDLYYSYIENPTSQKQATASVIVDSYGSVGTYTMIDVARGSSSEGYVPYISFRCESNADTTASVKIAYPTKSVGSDISAGVDARDMYTGEWEVSVVPTDNTPITDYTNVGVNKDSNGILQKFTASNDVKKSWTGANFAVGDSSTVYGNGTSNPVVSYAVSENGVLELAQKK